MTAVYPPVVSVTVDGGAGAMLTNHVTVEPVSSERFRIAIACRYRGDRADSGWVRAAVAAPGNPFWLIPGLFYGENRPDGCDRVFPRYRLGAPDPDGLSSSAWMFRADRAATAAVFAFSAGGGVALVADEFSAVGMTGVGFAGGASPEIALEFPVRESPASYVGLPSGRPPLAERYVWQPGEEQTFVADLYLLPPGRHAYADVLRTKHSETTPAAPIAPWVSVGEAADLAADGLLTWHYRREHRALVETAAFDRDFDNVPVGLGDRMEMHVAWLSGIPAAAALLRHGRRVDDDQQVAAAIDVLDNICEHPAPNGSLWGRWSAEHGWTQSWTPVRQGLHARTLAEATLFLIRAVVAEEADGHPHPQWRATIERNLRLARLSQDESGNLGTIYHADDGRVLSRAGAAGLAWVAPLAEAAAHFDDRAWRGTAEAAAAGYASALRREFLNGAPEDVDLAPTSEDGYVALMSYLALHRLTGDPEWLDLARHAADWLLTFRYTYDVRFPPRSMLGRYGFRTRGADQASPSNQHLHSYGLICTREMVELSVALGDDYYRARAEETLSCFRQFVAREDGDFNARRGMVAERYFQTECFRPKGMLQELSHAWCLGVLLIAAEDSLEFGAGMT